MLRFKNYLFESTNKKKSAEQIQFEALAQQIGDAKKDREYINLYIPGYHKPGQFTRISSIENLPNKLKADFRLTSPDGDDHHIFIGHKSQRHQQFDGVSKIEDVPFQKKILDRLDWQTHNVPSHIAVPSKYNHILKKVIWGENQGQERYGPHNIQVSYIGKLALVPHSQTKNDEPIHILEVDGDAFHNPQHGGKVPSNIVLYKRAARGRLRGTRIQFREFPQVPGTSVEIKQK